jgi:hypothetical protein
LTIDERVGDGVERLIGAHRRRSRDGRPATHRLIELPSVSKRTDRLRGRVAGRFVDG